MDGLIKQAFIHVDMHGLDVQEGRYDLEDSEGHIILPSLWSTTIKPGDTVSMRMWPTTKGPAPDRQHHMAPEQRMRFEMERQRAAIGDYARSSFTGHQVGNADRLRLPNPTQRAPFGGPPPPPQQPMFPPTGGEASRPHTVHIIEGGRPKEKGKKAEKTLTFFSGTKPSKKGRPTIVTPRRGEGVEESSKGENVEDIDKELGLDDLEEAEQLATKDIDELLENWTNAGGQK